MKMNTFAVNNTEDVETFPGREPLGNRAIGLVDAEAELVTELGEQRMSSNKLIATRFLTFLASKRLNVKALKLLTTEEQKNLKKEFLGE